MHGYKSGLPSYPTSFWQAKVASECFFWMKLRTFIFGIILVILVVTAPVAQAKLPYNTEATIFSQAMTVQHRQVILISKIASKEGNNPALEKIAQRIINEQAPEIAQLLRSLPVNGMAGMAGMAGMSGISGISMQGLLSRKELEQLKAARGKRFDGLYMDFTWTLLSRYHPSSSRGDRYGNTTS